MSKSKFEKDILQDSENIKIPEEMTGKSLID